MIFFQRILVLVLVSSCSITLASEDNTSICNKILLVDSTEVSPEQSRLMVGVSQLVQKNKRLPVAEELAWHLKIEIGELERSIRTSGGKRFSDQVLQLATQAKEIYPRPFQELRDYLARQIATFFLNRLRPPTSGEISELVGVKSAEEFALLYGSNDGLFRLTRENHPGHFEAARAKLIRTYAKLAKKFGRLPASDEVAAALDMSRDVFERSFGESGIFASLQGLKAAAWDEADSCFKCVVDTDIHNQDRLESMMQAIQNRERLIVTTAVAGARVNRNFFQAMLKYAELMDAEIIVYPANMETTGLDPILLETQGVHILTNTVHLSPWLALNKIKLIAKQKDPLMGLDNLGERGQSQIVGSPKMFVRTIPTLDNRYYPHRLYTTGAVTDPNYAGQKYIQGRTDAIATDDHVMGALVLEKNQGRSKIFDFGTAGGFHIRHIEFIADASGFYDLGRFFDAQAVKPVETEALVLGDVHVGESDQRLLAKLPGLIKATKPKLVVLHDLFNGHSVSHHDQTKLITLAEKARRGHPNLETELRAVAGFLNALMAADASARFVVVPSNHNDWISRWLQSGQFMREPWNTLLGLELAQKMSEGHSPLHYALLKFGLEYPKRLEFLPIGARLNVSPRKVELALHGHAGVNGAKGSIRSIRIGAGHAVMGHTHTYARMNGVVNVGTSTELEVSYNRDGMSNWSQVLSLVGPNGEQQALDFQNGEFFRRPTDLIRRSKEFFFPSYPKALPNQVSDGVGQVDQYGQGSNGRDQR